jgi:hypothetical protein
LCEVSKEETEILCKKCLVVCGKNTKSNGDKQIKMGTVPLKINGFGEQNTGFTMKKGKKCCRK